MQFFEINKKETVRKFYGIYFLFRYEPSEPVNVTVFEGRPTILNFSLNSREVPYDQGKIDVDYPQIVPLFNRFPAPYKMIINYDNPNY